MMMLEMDLVTRARGATALLMQGSHDSAAGDIEIVVMAVAQQSPFSAIFPSLAGVD